MSCGAPLAGPSPLVPPQPRPKGYHSLDHSIDPYSIPAGRLLAGQKSVVLSVKCGSLGDKKHLAQGAAGARCTVKVTERVFYLSPRGPPAAVQSVSHVSKTREIQIEKRPDARPRARAGARSWLDLRAQPCSRETTTLHVHRETERALRM